MCLLSTCMHIGTFDSSYLTALEDIGVTRLSLGIQSFNDNILKHCGRPHTRYDIYNAMNLVSKSSRYTSNFNIDLISSLPYLSSELWEETLLEAIEIQSTHISVYDLQIEEKSAFGRWYTPGIFPIPTESEASLMYEAAVGILTNNGGYEHYEVSNYAKPGKHSRHNRKYWACNDVLSFGMGAASLISGARYTRPGRRKAYEDWVDKRVAMVASPPAAAIAAAGRDAGTLPPSMSSIVKGEVSVVSYGLEVTRVDILEKVLHYILSN